MSTAAQDLAEGLATLDTEFGESYVLASSGDKFIARLERDRPRQLPDYSGTIRETVLHVTKAQRAFADALPAAGDIITSPSGGSARLARIDPGALPSQLMLVLAAEFT